MKQIKLLIQEYLAIRFLFLAAKVASESTSIDISKATYRIIGNQLKIMKEGA